MRLAAVAACLVFVPHLAAQPGTISTLMGAFPLGDGLPAPRANLTRIMGLAIDPQGRLLISETNRLRRIELDGRIGTLLGNGTWATVPAGSPREWPRSESIGVALLALAPDGAIYSNVNFVNACAPGIGSSLIWLYDPVTGILRTPLRSDVCGARIPGDGGPASAAFSRDITGLATDAAGRVYFSEHPTNRIRRIDLDGTIQTVAGNGGSSAEGDGGPATEANLRTPRGVALSPDGDLYIADQGNGRIRRVSGGIITTFALMANVRMVRFSKAGVLLASDGFNIRRFAPSGESSQLIYNGAARGRIIMVDMVEDRDGSLLISDAFQVWRLNADGSEAGHVAGVEPDAGKAGPPQFARVIGPTRTRPGPGGELWFTDGLGIRRLTAGGNVEPVSESVVPFAIAPDGVVYLLFNNRVDRIVDGRRSAFLTADKFGSNALRDIAVTEAGDLLISDEQNHRLLKVSPGGSGEIQVLAGNGTAGNAGDGGPAAKAQLNEPAGLALGADGAIYINVQGGIRKIAADGNITTVVGSGANCVVIPDAILASRVGNCQFSSLAVDPRNDIYFTTGDRLYRVRGPNVARISGGVRGLSGDGGPAARALLTVPQGLSVSPNGDLLIADSANNRIRRIQGYSPFAFSDDSVSLVASLNGPPAEETITVTSADGEAHAYRITVAYPAGRTGWLSVTPGSGDLRPGETLALRLTATVQGLPKGIYSARVTMTDTQSGEYTELGLILLVGGTQQRLRLTRTGFSFAAVQGGPVPPAQALNVQNSGRGVLPFSVATATLSGGNWLTATPSSGVADTNAQPELTLRANPAGLAPGVYFGLVRVNSEVADNSPASAVVLFQVLGATQAPAPIVDPAGLIFTSDAAQSITLANARAAPSTFTIAAPVFPDRRVWFTLPATALTGTIAPGQAVQVQIKPTLTGIGPGQYRAQLSIRFAPDNVTRVIELLLVVANTSGAAASKLNAAGSCKPTKLLPIFQQPGGGFTATAGWPQLVQLRVVDDCQDGQVKGRVRVSFNNGDPPLALTAQGNGVWTGTWSPGRAATRIDLSARAESFDPDLSGTQSATGVLRDDTTRPRIAPGGLFSDASLRRSDPVAIGSNFALEGTRLSSGTLAAETTPLPVRLGETSVLVGGRTVPLMTAADGQVKGVIPFSVPDATVQQVIVQRGVSYSLPETVLIAPVQPAIYTADGTGRGQGEIYVREEDRMVLADTSRPALGGEEIEIIATGLGAVDPKVEEAAGGAPDPVSQVISSLRLQIQGREAPVKSAVLIPGQPGRYRVAATVPQDVEADTSARVVLTLADQAVSNTVTMSVVPPKPRE